jgi:multicomponent K+:H+ antiporter subunit D
VLNLARLGALPDCPGAALRHAGHTLNLADLAYRLTLPGHDQALARLAFALLIAVFALKAGLLPLSFWLPHAYSAAGAPVAALFAIMTKVGIVAILRVQVIALAPAMPDLLDHWLTTLALATVVFAALGAVAAVRLRALAAWLVLLSAGTCCWSPAGAGECRGRARQRSTTWCNRPWPAPPFFLLAGVIAEQRGDAADHFRAGPPPAAWLKVAFLVAGDHGCRAAAFLRLRRQADAADDAARSRRRPGYLARPLCAGFVVMIALARDGCHLIWKYRVEQPGGRNRGHRLAARAATLLLVAAGPLLAVLARPLADYASAPPANCMRRRLRRRRARAAQRPSNGGHAMIGRLLPRPLLSSRSSCSGR